MLLSVSADGEKKEINERQQKKREHVTARAGDTLFAASLEAAKLLKATNRKNEITKGVERETNVLVEKVVEAWRELCRVQLEQKSVRLAK